MEGPLVESGLVKHPTNDELIERWHGEPAPLLPLLHAFQERDGYLSDDAIRKTAAALRIPLADLYGTVTFYHHFSLQAGNGHFRVCTGPICRLRGGLEFLEALGETAEEMPCAGRCDDPIPVIQGDTLLVGSDPDSLVARSSPLPPSNPGGIEECVFACIRDDGRSKMDGYRKNGGYEALNRAVLEMEAGDVIRTISESQLAGRGGAGFPTGRKWQAVQDAPRNPKTIVCNADEGEPGCFKDRVLMDHDPHAVIEGIILAAYATGATRGFIYLRYEYPETLKTLERALSEAQECGFLGNRILGTDFSFHLYLRRGAGAYICEEETSLLNSLEGKHPFPRNRPPYPVTHGYEDLPTVVNNVETLASVSPIVRKGPEWYRSLGWNDHSGTKLISLSGDIHKPGNYEVPLGMPLNTLLYEWAGGPLQGRTIQAVTMAGLSRWLSGRRGSGSHSGRDQYSQPRLFSGCRWNHGFRFEPKHGRSRPQRHEFFCRGIVRKVLPLPDRHPAPDGASLRRSGARGVRSLGRRGSGSGRNHEGAERLRAGCGCSPDQ